MIHLYVSLILKFPPLKEHSFHLLYLLVLPLQLLLFLYPFYYEIIEGATEFSEGKADEITGIETPDDKTIIFHLTEPAGDWPLRMGMPATSPTPESWASKYDKAKDS